MAPPPAPDPNVERTAALEKAYRGALASGDYSTAGENLNGFDLDGILERLTPLDLKTLEALYEATCKNRKVGPGSQLAQVLHDIIKPLDPDYFASPPPFPYNQGDKLGPVGGVVIAAAGGLLAARLAVPLLAGLWRQIQITAGMVKLAAEADKEDAELAEQEVGAVIDRLMNAGGSQRVLVTYQSMSPVADKELYLTTEEGAQYAKAVSDGRNLYQLRIPDQLYQLLVRRQLIDPRSGSMGDQVGEDIRIAPGAMQFLSKYFRQVPLK